MMRNEADIVESFVRHHLTLLDTLSVIVHCSTDGTNEILGELSKEGLPLEIFSIDELGFYQGQRMTQVARGIFEHHRPDFLFALDADEFVRASSRSRLEEVLGGIPSGAHGLLPWHTYVPTATNDFGETDPLRRIRKRHTGDSRRQNYFKLLVGKGFTADTSLAISHGNHVLVSPVAERARNQSYHKFDEPLLSHYPVRGSEQIATKTLVGWLSHIVIGDHTRGRSAHWRELYDHLKSQPKLSAEAVTSLALKYAQGFRETDPAATVDLVDDPLPVAFTIRYEHLRVSAPLAHVTAFAEKLALEYLALKQRL